MLVYDEQLYGVYIDDLHIKFEFYMDWSIFTKFTALRLFSGLLLLLLYLYWQELILDASLYTCTVHVVYTDDWKIKFEFHIDFSIFTKVIIVLHRFPDFFFTLLLIKLVVSSISGTGYSHFSKGVHSLKLCSNYDSELDLIFISYFYQVCVRLTLRI